MKRRTVIKSIGALSLGVSSASILSAEEQVAPYVGKNSQVTADIVVVGGGTAGTIAAIQAGRLGKKTILIESGSQLGGTTTTAGVPFPGIFHAWGKQVIKGIGWEIVSECVALNGDKLPDFTVIPDNKTLSHWVHQVKVNSSLYALLAEEKCIRAGVDIRYYETPVSVSSNNKKWLIESVGKGTRTQISCSQIIDCTGNALIASMAGYTVLREKETQPGSLLYKFKGIDFDKVRLDEMPDKLKYAILVNKPLEPNKEKEKSNFLQKVPFQYVYVPGADSTSSDLHTEANIQGRTKLLALLRKLKKYPGCENIRVTDMKTETAVRETYRIDGLYKIKREDFISGKEYEDSLSYSFYPVDLHREGKKIYQEFLKQGVVAKIPQRALIPKGSNNFIVAGRCVSSDRMANSALRVQASCMGMGQAAAVTASLAHDLGKTPADVPVEKIREVLIKHDAIVPS